MTYRIEVDRKTNRAKKLGIEEGKLTVAQEAKNSDYLILHCASTSHWSGIGLPRTSDRAEYQIYKITERVDEPEYQLTHITAELLTSFPVRPRQKGERQ